MTFIIIFLIIYFSLHVSLIPSPVSLFHIIIFCFHLLLLLLWYVLTVSLFFAFGVFVFMVLPFFFFFFFCISFLCFRCSFLSYLFIKLVTYFAFFEICH